MARQGDDAVGDIGLLNLNQRRLRTTADCCVCVFTYVLICQLLPQDLNSQLVKPQVFGDFPVGDGLVVAFPFVDFVGDIGFKHYRAHDFLGEAVGA